MRRLTGIVVMVGAALVGVIGLGSVQVASAASPWTVQSTPNPVIPTGEMFGASCTASTACTAVGYSSNSSGTDLTLAERWNGASWSVQTSPNPTGAIYAFLTGVSCTGPTSCVAVGYYGDSSGTEVPLAESWNGSTWSILSVPTPARATYSALSGVACESSSACIAVGNYGTKSTTEGALTEAWNGTAWSVQTTPTPSGASVSSFSGISCASTTSCMAVGSYFNSSTQFTLAETWNGSAWSITPTVNPTGSGFPNLAGVSCTSSTACTAVGSYFNPGTQVSLAERWNGTSWSVQTTPNPSGATVSGLSTVSCSTATTCTAAGVYTSASGSQLTLSAYWTGNTWYQQGTPNASNQVTNALLSVSCLQATNAFCFGVGFSSTAKTFTPLTIAYYGPLYPLLTPAPSPNGAATSVLSAVSCVSATSCTGVGYSTTPAGVSVLLVEAWNGSAWTIESAPVPAGAESSVFSGVSCPTAGSCEAVGSYVNSSGTNVTLAEQWNGTVWTIQTTPNPSGATYSVLAGVSCTAANACEAAGHTVTTSELPLAEVWNGTTWTVQVSRLPSGAIGGAFMGVSCVASPAGCNAVGYYDNSVSTKLTLAEGLIGPYGWIVATTATPTGATSSILSGVSCATNTMCIASGSYVNSTGTHTLTDGLSTTGWALQSPSSPGATLSAFTGVSCPSTTACTAVGYYINTSGITVTLAELWSGTSWAVQATPNPSIASASLLYGISCSSTTTCTAVGRYNNGVPLTLAEAN